jgi:hypothetical protein
VEEHTVITMSVDDMAMTPKYLWDIERFKVELCHIAEGLCRDNTRAFPSLRCKIYSYTYERWHNPINGSIAFYEQ